MPEISRFYGIVIKMYFDDHNPPHFHAEYGGNEALFSINSLSVIAGKLPPRAMSMTAEWANRHQQELKDIWEQAKLLQPLGRIVPLD